MNQLLKGFVFEDGVYFQPEFPRNQEFEKTYLALREKEKRVYTDTQVASLPESNTGHIRSTEWRLRKASTIQLLNYLNLKQPRRILDIGCGNGWLSNHLAKTNASVIAVDINEAELKQGARVFGRSANLAFTYADILSNPFHATAVFDLILLVSSVQYFENLGMLLSRLTSLLTDQGEIHIIDSPFYTDDEILQAKQRSADYYSSMGCSAMANRYYHHRWSELPKYEVLYSPTSPASRIKKMFGSVISPFPWIRLRK